MRELTTLDLFAGAGGITEGFREAGFRCVFANDFDSDALSTFKHNHPDSEVSLNRIEDVDAGFIRRSIGLCRGELDALVGGPPCQGFSINAPERFLDDPRNALFRHYLRFVEEFQPKTLLLENVPGMLSLGGGQVFIQILRELSALGYDTSHRILFAAHYGVPQERWRLIVLGSRIGPAPEHPFPTHSAKGRANFAGGRDLIYRVSPERQDSLIPAVNVADAIDDLPKLSPGSGNEVMEYDSLPHSKFAEDIRCGSTAIWHHVAPKISLANLERLRHIRPGGNWRDIPFELLPEGMKRAKSSDHTRRYGRLTRTSLASTVMTKMDPHWGAAFHYDQDRTLTVREAARLQSFPDRYIFSGPKVSQYKQVGNAVPVLLAKAVAESITVALNTTVEARDLILCP